MIRRRKTEPKPRPSFWIASDEYVANGRNLARGTEVTVRDHHGQRRRCRFIEHVTNEKTGTEWVTLTELTPDGKHRSTRSFAPDRILVVHTKKRLPPLTRKKAKNTTPRSTS